MTDEAGVCQRCDAAPAIEGGNSNKIEEPAMAASSSRSLLFGVVFAAGALLLVPYSNALAHDHHGDGWEDSDSHYHHHHHHHDDDKGPGGLGPVHGSGSSHNPVVGHPAPTPVVRDHRKPKVVRDHRKPKVVRDHRKPKNVRDPRARGFGSNLHCNKRDTTRYKVTDHRTPPKPQCYGNLC
jgi:hypothetical protein